MDSSGSQDRKSVPKFSSFKPLPTSSEPRPVSESRRQESTKRDDRDSNRSKRRHHGKLSRSERQLNSSSRHRSTRRRSRSPSRSRSSPQSPHERDTRRDEQTINFHAPRDQPSQSVKQGDYATVSSQVAISSGPVDTDLYSIDLKGDRYNLFYGTSHRYAVPSYRRVGYGEVLGLPGYIIDRENRDTDTIILRRKGLGRANEKASHPLSGRLPQPTQLFRFRIEDITSSDADLLNDTIALDPATRRASDIHDPGAESSDERHAYRSIHGKAKTEDLLPTGMEVVPGHLDHGDTTQIGFEAERKARNAELWKAVNANPTDVAAWIRLIDHQNILILSPGEDTRPLTYSERKAVAEVKLSLYDKAIAKTKNATHIDCLLLGRMQEGAQIWDRDKILAEWRRTCEENKHYVILWIKYLDFRQTDFRNFTFMESKQVLLDTMNFIAEDPSALLAPPNFPHFPAQWYSFLRLTLFLREAGYSELAVGLWQGVLEKACAPETVSNCAWHLSEFARFWDSEVARVGENGATGWQSGSSSAKVDPLKHVYHQHVHLSCLLPSWANAERERMSNARMPFRTLDEYNVDIDAAYSVVLHSDFQDIESLMPLFQNKKITEPMINAFLSFCYLPPLATSSSAATNRMWSGDNFLRNEFVDCFDTGISDWIPSNADSSQNSMPPFHFPASNFLHTTDTLFAPEDWFYSFHWWSKNILVRSSSIDCTFARRVLKFLAGHFNTNSELAEYALALEFAVDRRAAKKSAKSLLKSRSSDLRLYNAFALMQWRDGAQAIANQVWSTALTMSSNFEGLHKIDCGLLWISWAWQLLEIGDLARASYVLQSIPSQNIDLASFSTVSSSVEFTAAIKLRIQMFSNDCLSHALSLGKSQAYCAYVDCLGLVAYLSDNSLEAALDYYASAVAKLDESPPSQNDSREFTAELLHQSRAKLIYYHISRKGGFKPLQIHKVLKESIFAFPHNTMFLSLFMWNESRFPIYDRVRDPHALTMPKPSDHFRFDTEPSLSAAFPQKIPVTTHLFSIYLEFCRPLHNAATVYSIRAAFERAIGEHSESSLRPTERDVNKIYDNDSARSNLTVWKLYILFEIERARDIKAAKAVFFRAIRACPWSKQLVMLGFERLRGDLTGPLQQSRPEDGLTFDELQDLYRVLDSRQLRIHIDILPQLREVRVQRAQAADADARAKQAAAQAENKS
ncbi:hypothetical protein N7462_008098 [Penicillium macrosclerotiorum]|uniref:uncharacterized protein n=1 Tax=Penicillium macrosclerotiorum TaxID=303699 RepID=UPI002547B673|nr:uncharacterized protein N7462_008098 [Penicillium macrosclerotiorum]KAJ5679854.1 hypothetical protein N7462_008098 [Penicillium macrosclerotiorum]